MKRFFTTGIVCFAVSLGGCDSSNVDTLEARLLVASNNITSIEVTSTSEVIEVDRSRDLTLTGTIGDTETVVTRSAEWASSNPEIISVSNAGVVTGLVDGSATITATLGPLTSAIELRASTAVLQVINIETEATDATIDECASVSFTASGDYSDGETGRPITGLVAWSVSAGSIGVFDGDNRGLLRSNNAGVGTIEAALDGIEGTISLTVSDNLATISITDDGTTLSASNAVQYTATASYLDNANTVDITNNADWSLDASFASVSTSLPDKGIVTATSTGTDTLEASCGGQTGSLSVNSGSATEIEELFFNLDSPSRATFSGLETFQLNAFIRFENGTNRDVTEEADWIEISSNTALISVDDRDGSKGEVTIRGPGRLVIEARYLDDDNDTPQTFPRQFTVIRDAP